MVWSKDAQKAIAELFKKEFGNDLVETQWRSHAKNKDWLKFGKVYAPYPDIAIGPFNIHQGKKGEKERKEIKVVYTQHESFFQNLFCENISLTNENPRCLLAIEIEGSQKGKHMMGNIINASILGYIGIVVVNENKEKLWGDAEGVKKYLDGASVVKKIEPIAKNTMLFEYTRFMDGLEEARSLKKS